jgi:histidinol-phosphate aminotransferase
LAVEAMAAQAAIGQFYGDPEGGELRSALSDLHRVRPEEIVLAGGIDELLALFCRAYGDPGSRVVTTHGSYPTFEYGALGAGLEVVRIPYREDAVDLSALTEEAHRVDARIVYVANPDNPSGSWQTAHDLIAFRSSLPSDSLLLLDEAYADFAPVQAVPPLDTSDPGVLRLRTFSKAHGMAGLRVGYAIGHEATVRMLDRVRMHFGVSSVAQAGALASLRDCTHLDYVVSETGKGREHLAHLARGLGLNALPSATNFVLLDAGDKARADALLQGLLAEGVFVRKPSLPPLDRCVRITVGRAEDLDQLEAVLGRL